MEKFMHVRNRTLISIDINFTLMKSFVHSSSSSLHYQLIDNYDQGLLLNNALLEIMNSILSIPYIFKGIGMFMCYDY